MNRRDFSQLLPALLAAGALLPKADAQQGTMEHPVKGEPTIGPPTGDKPKGAVTLPNIASGVYRPGTPYGNQLRRKSRKYLLGMLTTGNIQIEMHQTTQEPGAVHEASDKHLHHNEIWCVKEGVCELTVNGVTRRMEAGDVGIVNAGDYHYIANAGDTNCTYFVITVGPPEQF